MAIIPGEIVFQANNDSWFTTNADVVFNAGITIYHQDGRYKFTDGVTALSALEFLGKRSLAQTLTIDNKTGAQNIESDNGYSKAKILDAENTLEFNNGSNSGSVKIDGNTITLTHSQLIKLISDTVEITRTDFAKPCVIIGNITGTDNYHLIVAPPQFGANLDMVGNGAVTDTTKHRRVFSIQADGCWEEYYNNASAWKIRHDSRAGQSRVAYRTDAGADAFSVDWLGNVYSEIAHIIFYGTASTVLVLDANKKIVSSGVSAAALTSLASNNSGTNTGDETAARIAAINHAATAKPALVDTDEITGQDSANSFSLIRTTWTNVKAFLKTYFDGIYTTTSAVATQITTALSGYLTSATAASTYQALSGKDATGGYAGLTLFKINFKNAANTFTSFFTNSNTAARTYTFKDADGTIAFTSDITGTNSGINTGDQTITLTGNVTGSGTGSFATTITSGAVTNAMLAGSIDLTTKVTGVLPNANGGTGFATYAVGDLLYASTTSALSKLADVAAGSYLRSGGVNTAPLWSTLVLPNSATANRLVYATGTNAWGDSANMTYDGSTVAFAGTGSDILTVTGSGNGSQRSGIRVNASNSLGQATNYMFNDRNATSSYGGQLYGGTTNVTGNLFGVSRVDKYFIFADGASNLGMCIGTLSAQPLILGTNNTNVIQIQSSGNVGIGTTVPTSILQVGGSLALAYVAKTANYTATISDYLIDCTANTFTVTLPTAIGITGRIYEVVNSGAGIITIATTSSQTFVNVTATPTTLTIASVLGKSIRVMSNGANWIELN